MENVCKECPKNSNPCATIPPSELKLKKCQEMGELSRVLKEAGTNEFEIFIEGHAFK